MNRLNTQLPAVHEQPKPPVGMHHVYGALFLLGIGILLIALIYKWEYGKKPTAAVNENNSEFCAQVITTAKNPVTGETKEFSNPCVVPSNWIIIR
jgi:hypothetical protein